MGTFVIDGEQNPSYLADLIGKISEGWRPAFERFVETGEAEAAFLDYLNKDLDAQEAVETAFNRQAAKFEDLAAELKKTEPTTEPQYKVAAPAKVAAAVQAALETPTAQREEVMQTSTAEIAASTAAEERIVLTEFARSLESNLTKVANLTNS
jgi:hypothetical protein